MLNTGVFSILHEIVVALDSDQLVDFLVIRLIKVVKSVRFFKPGR